MDQEEHHGLVRMVDDLDGVAARSNSGKVRLGDLLDQVGERSHGPLVLVPALIALMPTGAIPTVPTIMAALIVLVAVQIVFSPDHIWLPKKLQGFTIGTAKLRHAMDWARPWARKLSWLFRNRLLFVNEPPFIFLTALGLIAMAATMPFLELLPFAAAAPSFVMVVIGLGLTMDDGLWTLIGLSLVVADLGLFGYLLFAIIL